ncbi:MAG: hypothetical protein V4462_07325 [Pseudomonadota bacterium]
MTLRLSLKTIAVLALVAASTVAIVHAEPGAAESAADHPSHMHAGNMPTLQY